MLQVSELFYFVVHLQVTYLPFVDLFSINLFGLSISSSLIMVPLSAWGKILCQGKPHTICIPLAAVILLHFFGFLFEHPALL